MNSASGHEKTSDTGAIREWFSTGWCLALLVGCLNEESNK